MMPAHLLVADAGPRSEIVHGHEDAPLRRFEAVAHVGQGPAHDDAHGVGEVALLQLVSDVERLVVQPIAVAGAVGRRSGRCRGR